MIDLLVFPQCCRGVACVCRGGVGEFRGGGGWWEQASGASGLH